MKYLRHFVASFVIFVAFLGVFIAAYQSLEDNYGITKGDIQETDEVDGPGNIVDQLDKLQIRQGVERIESAVFTLRTGSASLADIAGALFAIGLGILQSVGGILIFPYQIVNIIVTFYSTELLGTISGLTTLVAVYAAFILLSAYLKHNV